MPLDPPPRVTHSTIVQDAPLFTYFNEHWTNRAPVVNELYKYNSGSSASSSLLFFYKQLKNKLNRERTAAPVCFLSLAKPHEASMLGWYHEHIQKDTTVHPYIVSCAMRPTPSTAVGHYTNNSYHIVTTHLHALLFFASYYASQCLSVSYRAAMSLDSYGSLAGCDTCLGLPDCGCPNRSSQF